MFCVLDKIWTTWSHISGLFCKSRNIWSAAVLCNIINQIRRKLKERFGLIGDNFCNKEVTCKRCAFRLMPQNFLLIASTSSILYFTPWQFLSLNDSSCNYHSNYAHKNSSSS